MVAAPVLRHEDVVNQVRRFDQLRQCLAIAGRESANVDAVLGGSETRGHLLEIIEAWLFGGTECDLAKGGDCGEQQTSYKNADSHLVLLAPTLWKVGSQQPAILSAGRAMESDL